MNEVKRLEKSLGVCQGCEHDHDVEDLVRCAKYVKHLFAKPFGKLRCVSLGLDYFLNVLTLMAYAVAPSTFNASVTRTQEMPIRWL